jgi:lysozyme
MRVIGVDVSHWEGTINWDLAAPALGFAYYKATDGTGFIDAQFGNNKNGCNATGLPHAAYHWFQPSQDPKLQARHYIETLGTGYRRYIADFEMAGCTATNMKAFLDECTRLTGIKPAIYTGAGFWNSISPRPTWANQYDLIHAQYSAAHNPTLPAGWITWKIWQNSDYFFFPGCVEIADGNWFNGTMQECRDWFGNYHPYNPLPPPPVGGKTQMIVTANQLNIRDTPSTAGMIIGTLIKNNIIDVYDVSGTDGWIKHAKGWSAAKVGSYKYIEPV